MSEDCKRKRMHKLDVTSSYLRIEGLGQASPSSFLNYTYPTQQGNNIN